MTPSEAGIRPHEAQNLDRRLFLIALVFPVALLGWTLPAGVFFDYRVDAVASAYPLLVAATWAVVGWHIAGPGLLLVRICLVVLAVIVATIGTVALSPGALGASAASSSGKWVASAAQIGGAGGDSRISIVRPGRVVSRELAAICTTNTSGVLSGAVLSWTSPEDFTLSLNGESEPYVSFRVDGDRLEPDADLDWRDC